MSPIKLNLNSSNSSRDYLKFRFSPRENSFHSFKDNNNNDSKILFAKCKDI